MRRVSGPKQRLWVISALLVALVVRALIPAGFMPATDRPFSFQICPDGFPTALLADGAATGAGQSAADGGQPDAPAHAGHHHGIPDAGHHDHGDGLLALSHHHNHNTASAEHCVFAAAAGVFALAFAPTFSAPAATLGAPESPYVALAFESRRFRLPQPRGPPALS